MARPQPSSKQPLPQKGKGKGLLTDSLSFANAPLLKVPSLASYTNLHKLDLSNCSLRDVRFVKEAKRTLTWLNVSGNEGLNWDGIEELSGLFVLNASHCELERVPSHIESLRFLKALVLSHNKLTQLEHIRRLPNLNTLVVSNNLLTSLPSSLTTLPSLKKLSCAHNALTSSSLPDLTPLIHLREIALNTNPSLTSLPDHFATWGKGENGDGRGLEILDLGNCGIQSWMEVKGLGGQRGLLSLGLKGTLLEKEGVENEGGLEGFRKKLLILLPSLRILSNVRFDSKFIDLKQKRLERAPEQKILDAGPMAWRQILGDDGVAEKADKISAQEAENGTVEEAGKIGRRDEKKTLELRRMRRLVEEKLRERQVIRSQEVGVSDEKVEKKKRKASQEAVPIASTSSATNSSEPDATEVPQSEKRKKRKNRHEARGLEMSSNESDLSTTQSKLQPEDVSEAPKIKKKRGRRSKSLGSSSAPTDTPAAHVQDEPAKKRKKKDPGGMLSALRGDGTEIESVRKPAEVPVPIKENESKERSSVVKVVEVKKKEGGEGGKVDNESDLEKLLGLWSGDKNGAENADLESGGGLGQGSGWD